MSSQQHAPSFPIARMERRTSAKGTEYFSGFLGGARITLLRSKETGRDACEIWHLMMAEGKMFPMKDADSAEPKRDPVERSVPGSTGRAAAMRNYAAPPRTVAEPRPSAGSGPDAEIPF